jgi:hypothetical protein
LPCPFCGGVDELLPDEFLAAYWNIQFRNDRCGAIQADVSARHAALKWNRRHATKTR